MNIKASFELLATLMSSVVIVLSCLVAFLDNKPCGNLGRLNTLSSNSARLLNI